MVCGEVRPATGRRPLTPMPTKPTGEVLFGINTIYSVAAGDGRVQCRIKGKKLKEAARSYNPIAAGDIVELVRDALSPGRDDQRPYAAAHTAGALEQEGQGAAGARGERRPCRLRDQPLAPAVQAALHRQAHRGRRIGAHDPRHPAEQVRSSLRGGGDRETRSLRADGVHGAFLLGAHREREWRSWGVPGGKPRCLSAIGCRQVVAAQRAGAGHRAAGRRDLAEARQGKPYDQLLRPCSWPVAGCASSTPRECGSWRSPRCFPRRSAFTSGTSRRSCSRALTSPACTLKSRTAPFARPSERGEIHPDRYESYLRIVLELQETRKAAHG